MEGLAGAVRFRGDVSSSILGMGEGRRVQGRSARDSPLLRPSKRNPVELVFDGQCACESAKRGALTGPNPTDRAKSGCKRHVLIDGRGVPLGLLISGANLHDKWAALASIDTVKRFAPSHRKRPTHCCLDKGYDFGDVEQGLKKRGIIPHIRRRGEELRSCHRGRPRRWKVERTNSWHNQFRGLLIRWDVKPEHYEALALLASSLIAFRVAFW